MREPQPGETAGCAACGNRTWLCLNCRYNQGDTYAVRILSPAAAYRPVVGHLERKPRRHLVAVNVETRS